MVPASMIPEARATLIFLMPLISGSVFSSSLLTASSFVLFLFHPGAPAEINNQTNYKDRRRAKDKTKKNPILPPGTNPQVNLLLLIKN